MSSRSGKLIQYRRQRRHRRPHHSDCRRHGRAGARTRRMGQIPTGHDDQGLSAGPVSSRDTS